MLEDDIVIGMKRMVASTFDSRGNSWGKGKGKRSQPSRDAEQEQSDGFSIHALENRPSDALNLDIDSK